jgi:hypothetical protein
MYQNVRNCNFGFGKRIKSFLILSMCLFNYQLYTIFINYSFNIHTSWIYHLYNKIGGIRKTLFIYVQLEYHIFSSLFPYYNVSTPECHIEKEKKKNEFLLTTTNIRTNYFVRAIRTFLCVKYVNWTFVGDEERKKEKECRHHEHEDRRNSILYCIALQQSELQLEMCGTKLKLPGPGPGPNRNPKLYDKKHFSSIDITISIVNLHQMLKYANYFSLFHSKDSIRKTLYPLKEVLHLLNRIDLNEIYRQRCWIFEVYHLIEFRIKLVGFHRFLVKYKFLLIVDFYL